MSSHAILHARLGMPRVRSPSPAVCDVLMCCRCLRRLPTVKEFSWTPPAVPVQSAAPDSDTQASPGSVSAASRGSIAPSNPLQGTALSQAAGRFNSLDTDHSSHSWEDTGLMTDAVCGSGHLPQAPQQLRHPPGGLMFPGGSISSCWQTPAMAAMPAASQSQNVEPLPWEASEEPGQAGSVRASSSWSVGAQPTSSGRGSKMAVGSAAVLSPRLTSDEAASLVATGAPKHAAAVRLTASETILPTARLAALMSQPVPQSAGFAATERQVECLFTGPGGSSSGSSVGDLADAGGVSKPDHEEQGFCYPLLPSAFQVQAGRRGYVALGLFAP